MTKTVRLGALIVSGGLFAGIMNGLLGTGGGIVLVFLLSYILGSETDDSRDIYANAIAVVMPVSVVSLILYAIRGMITDSNFGIYIIPAVAGGLIGGILLGRIKTDLLKKMFAILVIYSGISMILK